jgi:hypothetical protein
LAQSFFQDNSTNDEDFMFGKYFEQIKNLHIIILKYIYFKSEFIGDIFP